MIEGEIKFRFDWEPAPGVRAPELRVTWARLEIWVGDECITQVEDIESRSIRRSVYVPLYPLAEWIAYNWWFLKAHSRPASLIGDLGDLHPARGRRAALVRMREHHNLRAAGDGFLWPNLTIVPEGRHIHLVWYPDDAAKLEGPIRYIRGGEAWIERESLESSLTLFVQDVVTRLSEHEISETSLQKEWEELQGTDLEEAAFSLAAARLGLDPYSDALGLQDSIERAAVALEPSLLDDFYDAVNPQRMAAGITWVVDSTRRIGDQAPYSTRDNGLRAEVEHALTDATQRPWDLGYGQAARVRSVLGLGTRQRFELGDLMSVLLSESHDVGLQAIGRTSGGTNLLVLGRPMIPPTQRFAQARALWHFLFGRVSDPFLITPAHTDRQRVERAFAAELLAPAAGIRDQLDLTEIEFAFDDIEPIAEHFEVSSMVIQHQIENQILARS